MSDAEKQLVTTVDPIIGNTFNQMKAELEQAKANAAQYGGNTIARTETKYTTGPGGEPAGTYEVKFTYAQEAELAAKRLNEFREEHEEAIKRVEAYDKTLEKVREAGDKIRVLENERKELLKDLNNAKKEEEVVDLEVQAQKKKLARTYKE